MTSKRVPLALTLGVFLFVTAGFAATKKFQRNDGSTRELRTICSLQNGGLPDARSSLSGGSSGFQSSGAAGVLARLSSLASPAPLTIGSAGRAIGAMPPTGVLVCPDPRAT